MEGVDEAALGDLAEATVVGRAQDGDLAAFETLVRHYQGPLYRLSFRVLGDRGEAADALQDTLVQVWRKLPGLADPQGFRRWIYQITTGLCVSVLRERARSAVDPAAADDLVEVASDHDTLTGRHSEDSAAVAQYHAEVCPAPGLMEALIPREDESHGGTEEVPGGASGACDPVGCGCAS